MRVKCPDLDGFKLVIRVDLKDISPNININKPIVKKINKINE